MMRTVWFLSMCIGLCFCLPANAGIISVTDLNGTLAGAGVSHVTGGSGSVSLSSSPADPNVTDATVVTQTWSFTGLDLSSVEAGATNASFDFTLTYSSFNSGSVDPARGISYAQNGSGNIGIRNNTIASNNDNSQVFGNETLELSLGAVSNVTGFSGVISLDGFTRIRLANFANDEDEVQILTDSGLFRLRGANDVAQGTGTADAIGDTLNFTPVDAAALFGPTDGGFSLREFDVQFSASASAVPEPGSIAMISLLAFGTLIRRRRR